MGDVRPRMKRPTLPACGADQDTHTLLRGCPPVPSQRHPAHTPQRVGELASHGAHAQVMDGSGGRPKIPMIRYMLGTILVTAPLGALNSWDRLGPILVAFLQADHQMSADDQLEMVPIVSYISASVSMMGMGWILGRRDAARSRAAVVVCVVLGALVGMTGLVLTSICTTRVGVTVCYGWLFGAAMGAYLVPLYYASQCFPHTVGVTVGFANCCLGAGQLGMCLFLGSLLGIGKLPKGTTDDVPMEVYKRIPDMFRIHALAHVLSMGLGVVILPDPRSLMLDSAPNVRPTSPPDENAAGDPSVAPSASVPESADSEPRASQVMKRWYFWLLPLTACAISISGSLVVGNYAHIGVNFNSVDVRDVSDIADWAVVAGIVGRFLWGMAADASGYHASLLASGVLTAAFVLSYGFIRNSAVFHAWTCFITFFYVGNLAILPTAVQELFGFRVFARLFPVVFAGCLLGNVLALSTSHPFVDVSQTTGHFYLSVIAFVLGTGNLVYFPVRRINQSFHPFRHGDHSSSSTEAGDKPAADRLERTATLDSGSVRSVSASQRGSEVGSGNWMFGGYHAFRSPGSSGNPSDMPTASPIRSDDRPVRTTNRLFSNMPLPYDELRPEP